MQRRTAGLLLDDEARYAAMQAHDARFVGQFHLIFFWRRPIGRNGKAS